MHSDLVISRADGRPMYAQIMDQVRQRIAVGDWPPGEEIPSIRQLAVTLRVSVITIKRAYLELEREGVIVTQHGKPSRVASQPAIAAPDYEGQLAAHIAETARLGDLVGLAPGELSQRLRDAAERLQKERT
ncbi:MAG: GntR family transcriptional regulator [Vicinamibacteria bacterium]